MERERQVFRRRERESALRVALERRREPGPGRQVWEPRRKAVGLRLREPEASGWKRVPAVSEYLQQVRELEASERKLRAREPTVRRQSRGLRAAWEARRLPARAAWRASVAQALWEERLRRSEWVWVED